MSHVALNQLMSCKVDPQWIWPMWSNIWRNDAERQLRFTNSFVNMHVKNTFCHTKHKFRMKFAVFSVSLLWVFSFQSSIKCVQQIKIIPWFIDHYYWDYRHWVLGKQSLRHNLSLLTNILILVQLVCVWPISPYPTMYLLECICSNVFCTL